MASPYGSRKLMAVKPMSRANFMYGFLTNMDAADSAVLGQVSGYAANGGYIAGLTIGANAPKPARAAKKRASGYSSSFVDVTKTADARTAGWKITSRSKYRKAVATVRSVPVYITIATLTEGGQEGGSDINYAWRMRKETYDKITPGDKTGLGIVTATAATTELLVFGASTPRPPRVTFNAVGATISSTYTTFCDPDKLDSLPSGWVPVDNNGYEG